MKLTPARVLGALLFGAVLIGGGFTVFKLFEPVFVYTSGWAPAPPRTDAPTVFETLTENRTTNAEKAEAALRAAYAAADFPALSAAVAADGRLVWRGAVGYADLETRSPATFDTTFRMGSTSKAVTALAVGVLMDRGALSLDDRMGDLDPTLAQPVADVTLGQAMSHRAGVRNYGMCWCFPAWEYMSRKRFAGVREAVALIEDDPLLFQPGQSHAYTSLGYNLAGLAVVRAAERPFDEVLAQEISRPLGLKGLRVDRPEDAESTGFYEIKDGAYKRAFPIDNSIRTPSGGLRASPSEIATLGLAVLDDRLVSEGTRKALLTIPADGRENGGEIYANGFRVGGWDIEGAGELIHHNGVAAGSRSVFVVAPEHGLVVSLFANEGGENINDLAPTAKALLQAFLPERDAAL
jgi:serine beta-lactamase-like protein LACTB, mitochondrial